MFLLPLLPEFSTKPASKLPQVLPQKSMLLMDRDIDVIAILSNRYSVVDPR